MEEALFRTIRRQILSARRCLPSESLTLHFEAASADKGKLEVVPGSSEKEFAVAMRPFVDPDSTLWLPRLWEHLKTDIASSIGQAEAAELEDAISRWQSGIAGLEINGQRLAAEDLSRLVWKGFFGNADPAALAILGPNPPTFFFEALLWLYFWSNRAAFEIANSLLAAMYKLGHGVPPLPPTKIGPCIYCMSSKGPFSSQEHILSESLIGEGPTLPVGTVCDPCNHQLSSQLDQALLDFPPIAFHRVAVGPLTKKSRFPRADLGSFTFERTGPGTVKLNVKEGAPDPVTPVGAINNDASHFQIAWTLERPHSLMPLARALTKIALGFLALDTSADRVRDPIFDDARAFIRGEKGFANNLIIRSEMIPTPSPSVACRVLDSEHASGALFNILGIECAISLRPQPELKVTDDLAESGLVEWSLDRSS